MGFLSTFVCMIPTLFAAPLTITDFWEGRAHFQLVSKARFDEFGMTAMNVGFDFVTRPGGVWYLFHREYNFRPKPKFCPADFARVVVRKSTDQGRTWSNASIVAAPPVIPDNSTGPQAPDECAIVDGAGYYDPVADMWHYLSQCLNRSEVWNLCHYSLKGPDPMAGPFTPNSHNPVVTGGQLWRPICANSKNCDKVTHDEGTPDIVMTDSSGYHYVTFHGCNDGATRSVRGVAKTKDFVTWETSGDGIPGDAIFGQVDCNKWNISWAGGTCVGGGEGSILVAQDGYMYMLIEAPDISLGCLGTQQNWVLGLLRSKTFTAAGTWEQFRVSPTVVPVIKQGCYIQYHRIFQDDQGTYLEFWTGDNDGWMQIHSLVPGSGPLPIVADGHI